MKIATNEKRYPSFKDDHFLLEEIKKTIKDRPTYGYRRITAILNSKPNLLRDNRVNHKRIYRIMSENNL